MLKVVIINALINCKCADKGMNSSRSFVYGQHLLPCLIIFLFYLPIAAEYYAHFPPSGFDFYQMPAYESYLRRNFGFWTGMWKYTWFSGGPLSRDYALLHMYFALPFASYYGDVAGCRIYLLLTFYLFAVASYFLFFELSKSRAVSLLLANTLVWSPNVYLAFFGGLLTFAATQMFLPISLYSLAKYFHTEDKRFLFFASGISGLSILSHQAAGGLLVFLPSLIATIFWTKNRLSLKRLGTVLAYATVTMLICMPYFAVYNYNFLALSQILLRIAQENPAQYARVYAPQAWEFLPTTNFFLYLILSVALAYVIAKRNPNKVVNESVPFIVILVFLFIFQFLFYVGHNPVQSFIQPYRIFWLFPLIMASMMSIWLGSLFKSLQKTIQFENVNLSFSVRAARLGLLLGLLLFPPLMIRTSMKAYLDGNNAEPQLINEVLVNEKRELLNEIIPAWLNSSRTDYRLYTNNPYFSIWWNIISPMPITHGYFQALTPDQNYWKNWLDASITGSLYVWGNYSNTIIENQALFTIDWFAVKYLVGKEQVGFSLAPYLNEYFSKVDHRQNLQFAEIMENLASPIVEATNAPAVLVISEHDWYRSILRDLFASVNLNSESYVPVRGPEYIDDSTYAELKDFDCVYLYTYKYHSFDKAFELLGDYVADGGSLIIDTGFECPESNSSRLPEFFPINKSVRSTLGEEWDFTVSDSPITQGVNFSEFDRPIFLEGPWTLSYVPSDGEVKPGAVVVLRNRGYPVIVAWNYGNGKVVWSGMNLPFHVSEYKNLEEAVFHKNLVEWAVQPQSHQNISFSVERSRPEKVFVEGYSGFRGVLFRENAFDGWTAQLVSNGVTRKLEIYHAGPDFMYVRVPSDIQAPFTIRFRYFGSFIDWFFAMLSSITLFIVLDFSLLKGRIVVNRALRPIARKFGKPLKQLVSRVREWWLKE